MELQILPWQNINHLHSWQFGIKKVSHARTKRSEMLSNSKKALRCGGWSYNQLLTQKVAVCNQWEIILTGERWTRQGGEGLWWLCSCLLGGEQHAAKPSLISGSWWWTMISLSIQYEQKPLYFCTSNVSHWCGLTTTHCTNVIPPAAHVSLCNCSLMLHLQVTLFTQQHFNLGLLVCGLGHFQQFRQCLFEPATIHMQWCSQNLAKHVPPSFYCGNIVVLVIVLYCITIAAVSHLICPVAGMTSYTTHCTMWL